MDTTTGFRQSIMTRGRGSKGLWMLFLSIGLLIGVGVALRGSWEIIILIILAVLILSITVIANKPEVGLYLVPVTIIFDTHLIPLQWINLSLSNVLIPLILLSLGLRTLSGRATLSRKLLSDPGILMVGISVLYLSFNLLSSLFSVEVTAAFRSTVTTAGNVLLLLIIILLVKAQVTFNKLIRVYTLTAVVSAALGLLQIIIWRLMGITVGRLDFNPTRYFSLGNVLLEIPRISSTWSDPNQFGLFLVPAIPLLISMASNRTRLKAKAVHIIYLSCLVLALVFTYSRGAWSAAVLALAAFWVFNNVSSSKNRGRAWAMIMFGGVVVGIVMLLLWSRGEVAAIAEGEVGRWLTWREAWDTFKDYPWTGVGAGVFRSSSGLIAHNSYLAVLVGQGIFAATAFLALLIFPLSWALQSLHRLTGSSQASTIAALLAGYMGVLYGLIWIQQPTSKFLWLLVALLTVGARFQQEEATKFKFSRAERNPKG